MQKNLLKYNRDQEYIDFDFETEGLNLVYSRPWELAWNIMKNGRIVKEFRRLIYWEDLNIPSDVKRMCGFDQTEYDRESLPPQEVWDEFKEYLYDESYILIGQNVLGFDVFMVMVLCRLLGIDHDPSYLYRILDTLALEISIRVESKPSFPDTPEGRMDRYAWQLKMINEHRGKRSLGGMSQIKLLDHYDIDYNKDFLHGALYDISKNGEVFFKQLRHLEL